MSESELVGDPFSVNAQAVVSNVIGGTIGSQETFDQSIHLTANAS